ncbi:MAG: MATE family efflux transporter [Planctomycetes bacterium]|nr:MATE family efflux transporter [Planctomycetota bacterium]
MATAPVGRLLLTMSLPLMLSMIMEALYNVVDTLFVSHLDEKALTALTLAFPIQLLVISISVGTGVGVNSYLSRLLGERNAAGVNRAAGNGIFLACVTYLVFLCFGLFLTDSYFAWQTTDPDIHRYGVEYLTICLVFSFGATGQIMFQRLLQSTGKTGLSMASQLVGAVCNIILDPILIFGLAGFPALGVRGAAIATVCGQMIALVITVTLNFTKNREIRFAWRECRPDGRILAQIYRVGAPAILMQSLNPLQGFGVNTILMGFSPTAVAAFGVYIRIQNFIFMPALGLGNGVIALTAFNYGARNRRRVEQTMRYGFCYSLIIMVTGMVCLQVFAPDILSLFDASRELVAIGTVALRVISLSFVFVAFTLIAQGLYQALGNGVYSLLITLMRVVVVLLPVLYFLATRYTLDRVWWAFFLAEGASAALGAYLLHRIYVERVAPLDHGEIRHG